MKLLMYKTRGMAKSVGAMTESGVWLASACLNRGRVWVGFPTSQLEAPIEETGRNGLRSFGALLADQLMLMIERRGDKRIASSCVFCYTFLVNC